MTLLYLDFRINVTADNVKRDANKKLICASGQKIRLVGIGIAPLPTEDSFILISKGQEQLFGDGIHHGIIDDFTHFIEIGAVAVAGEEFIASARGPTERIIHGVYIYEILPA